MRPPPRRPRPQVSAKGTAAVVDGPRLLLTPLRHSLVPPPMCAAAAELPAPVAALALGESGSCEALAALMSDGRLALLRAVEEDLWEETLEVGGAKAGKHAAKACRRLARRGCLGLGRGGRGRERAWGLAAGRG
jgi:hypothetical protein